MWSVTSWVELRRDGVAAEKEAFLNPGDGTRTPFVAQQLAGATGPVVAVSDWIAAWPDLISRWVPTSAWRSLGTDGYGRSDTRQALRRFFDIDAAHIATAVLVELGHVGALPAEQVSAWVAELDIQPEAPFALGH